MANVLLEDLIDQNVVGPTAELILDADPWLPNHAYVVGDRVTFGGADVYVATRDFTSGAESPLQNDRRILYDGPLTGISGPTPEPWQGVTPILAAGLITPSVPDGRVFFNPGENYILSAVDEKWSISGGAVTLGTFKVTVGANTTTALAFDISTPDLITALEALASVGPGNIQENPDELGATLVANGAVYLQWINDLGASDQPPATITDDTTDGGLSVVEDEKGVDPLLEPDWDDVVGPGDRVDPNGESRFVYVGDGVYDPDVVSVWQPATEVQLGQLVVPPYPRDRVYLARPDAFGLDTNPSQDPVFTGPEDPHSFQPGNGQGWERRGDPSGYASQEDSFTSDGLEWVDVKNITDPREESWQFFGLIGGVPGAVFLGPEGPQGPQGDPGVDGDAGTLAQVLAQGNDADNTPITGLQDPTNPQDAATRGWILDHFAQIPLVVAESDVTNLQDDLAGRLLAPTSVTPPSPATGTLDIPGDVNAGWFGADVFGRFTTFAANAVIQITVTADITTGFGVVRSDASGDQGMAGPVVADVYTFPLPTAGEYYIYGFPSVGETGAGTWAFLSSGDPGLVGQGLVAAAEGSPTTLWKDTPTLVVSTVAIGPSLDERLKPRIVVTGNLNIDPETVLCSLGLIGSPAAVRIGWDVWWSIYNPGLGKGIEVRLRRTGLGGAVIATTGSMPGGNDDTTGHAAQWRGVVEDLTPGVDPTYVVTVQGSNQIWSDERHLRIQPIAAHVADGSTVDQLRDAFIAAGLMATA